MKSQATSKSPLTAGHSVRRSSALPGASLRPGAPDRLTHGIAHVVTRQADVGEQRRIQLRQYGNVPAVSDGAETRPIGNNTHPTVISAARMSA